MKLSKKASTRLFNFVYFTMIASVVVLSVLFILAPTEVPLDAPAYVHPKTYYVLMIVESLLGCIIMYYTKKIEGFLEVPSYMMIPFLIFLFCAIFLGEVRNFYYRFKNFDTYLHFCSAGMLASLGFSLMSILNKSDHVPMTLSPFFIAAFAFTFAVTCGALWEIYEFTFDGLLKMNMQKFALESGEVLIGRSALMDTMKDIITDTIGAFIVSAAGYAAMKRHSIKWINGIQLRRKKKSERIEKAD